MGQSQPPRPKDFVRQVIDHLELEDNPRQRARKSENRGAGALGRLLSVDRNTVVRWLDGSRAPEYLPTMQMLQMCGWLNMAAEAPSSDASEPSSLAPLEVIAEGLEEILALVRELHVQPETRVSRTKAARKQSRRKN